jgi:hypothetical protein
MEHPTHFLWLDDHREQARSYTQPNAGFASCYRVCVAAEIAVKNAQTKTPLD